MVFVIILCWVVHQLDITDIHLLYQILHDLGKRATHNRLSGDMINDKRKKRMVSFIPRRREMTYHDADYQLCVYVRYCRVLRIKWMVLIDAACSSGR